ncbi:MAG TPA: ABC transporter ATP-binding protein [Kofleriaceae bacterium]|nr:ABC transporter ATP-binding protein [Kofleriaceae bacterium]
MTALLETRGLRKTYGDAVAVAGLDFEIARGEIVGLLGPNGAGKTTTISMICGVVKPTTGTVRVAGHDMARDSFAARNALGLVPQDVALYEPLSARQNLAFFGSLYGLRGATLRERIDQALAIAGLAERATEPVSRFSGGMKRRLNLAAGLLHRPALLLLDEPTVGVDPQSRKHLFDSIRQLRAEHGTTVLYTSHYMEEVQALCDRVAIMDRGELVASDTVEALIAAHGGGTLELDVLDPAAAVAAIGELGEATIVGERVRVVPRGELAPIVAAVEASGATVRGLRTLSADLETVFLTLTGHRLRD